MKRCKHMSTRIAWRRHPTVTEYEIAFARHCSDCGEALSLGPSNDVDVGPNAAVAVEIQAARLEVAVADMSRAAADGYGAHLEDADPPPDCTLAWHIGWLVREMRMHEHRDNTDRYDWDPTRPLAEQAIGTVEIGVIAGPEPEHGVELEVYALPTGSDVLSVRETIDRQAGVMARLAEFERANALVIESDAPEEPEAPVPLDHASDCDLGGES